MPVNINYFTSQQSTQGNQRSKGHGLVEMLPRIQSLAAGIHETNIFKSTYSETARKLGGGHQKKSFFWKRLEVGSAFKC